MGGHALLQGLFLTQGLNPHLLCLLHWQAGSLALTVALKPGGSYSLRLLWVLWSGEAVPRRVTLYRWANTPFFYCVFISVPSFYSCVLLKGIYTSLIFTYQVTEMKSLDLLVSWHLVVSFLKQPEDWTQKERFEGQFCHLCSFMPLITKRNFWFLTKYFPCIIIQFSWTWGFAFTCFFFRTRVWCFCAKEATNLWSFFRSHMLPFFSSSLSFPP